MNILFGLIGVVALVGIVGFGILTLTDSGPPIDPGTSRSTPLSAAQTIRALDERCVANAEKALSKADNVSKHEVDKDSVEQAKTEAPKPTSVA